jgi:hypothetical protein
LPLRVPVPPPLAVVDATAVAATADGAVTAAATSSPPLGTPMTVRISTVLLVLLVPWMLLLRPVVLLRKLGFRTGLASWIWIDHIFETWTYSSNAICHLFISGARLRFLRHQCSIIHKKIDLVAAKKKEDDDNDAVASSSYFVAISIAHHDKAIGNFMSHPKAITQEDTCPTRPLLPAKGL